MAIVIAFGVSQTSFAQCVGEDAVNTPWTNIPYFDGDDSHIIIRKPNDSSSDNASEWFQGSFSFDMWIKPTFEHNVGEDRYFLFGAGPWDDDYNSLFLYFEQYDFSNDKWRFRIGDGDDSGSNDDLYTYINYHDNYDIKN